MTTYGVQIWRSQCLTITAFIEALTEFVDQSREHLRMSVRAMTPAGSTAPSWSQGSGMLVECSGIIVLRAAPLCRL